MARSSSARSALNSSVAATSGKTRATEERAIGMCYGIHHRDMSVRQVKDTNRNVGGDHVDDGDGTVEFVSALLYDTMYSRDDYGNPLEEDTGKDYTNE
jgi:hypothetical protein